MLSTCWCRAATLPTMALGQANAAPAADEAAAMSTVQPYLLPAAMILAALGVWLMLTLSRRTGRMAGGVVALLGFVALGLNQAPVGDWLASTLFWLLAGIAVIAAGATISARSPVYSAVCFAVTLLGVAGLFLLSGSQFLGIATVAVYAGAIVVTFLFVVMLAQSEGHAYYDRLSWGTFPPVAAALAGAMIVGGVAYLSELLEDAAPAYAAAENPVLVKNHMANFGRELFSVHLISVEIAGTLLLVALVGAIAMVIQGRDPVLARRESEDAAAAGQQVDRIGARRLQPVGDNGRE